MPYERRSRHPKRGYWYDKPKSGIRTGVVDATEGLKVLGIYLPGGGHHDRILKCGVKSAWWFFSHPVVGGLKFYGQNFEFFLEHISETELNLFFMYEIIKKKFIRPLALCQALTGGGFLPPEEEGVQTPPPGH